MTAASDAVQDAVESAPSHADAVLDTPRSSWDTSADAMREGDATT